MLSKTDREYLVMAYKAATESPDPSTQNGAVIPHYFMGRERYYCACNTFPEGVKSTPERLERPMKYNYIEHAERNCINMAAKNGLFSCVNPSELTLYVPWFACSDCARSIIASGIKRVVGHKRMMDATPEHWKESIKHAFVMFEEAKVEWVLIPDELPEAPQIRFNGELWQP